MKIFGVDYSANIVTRGPVELDPTGVGMEITADVDDQVVKVTLNAYGVRKLRLECQRFERALKAQADKEGS